MSAYGKVWSVRIGDARAAKAAALGAYASQIHPIPPETTSALPPGFVSAFSGDEEFLLER
jgi:hypothetical protein